MSGLTLNPETKIIQIRGELSFVTVNHVLDESVRLFDSVNDLEIDLSEVHRSDSAGLALLVHWIRTAKQENKKIVFHNIPAQMLAIADVSGLDELLPIQ